MTSGLGRQMAMCRVEMDMKWALIPRELFSVCMIAVPETEASSQVLLERLRLP